MQICLSVPYRKKEMDGEKGVQGMDPAANYKPPQKPANVDKTRAAQIIVSIAVRTIYALTLSRRGHRTYYQLIIQAMFILFFTAWYGPKQFGCH